MAYSLMPPNPLPAATPYTSADVPQYDQSQGPSGMLNKLQMLQSLMPQKPQQPANPQKQPQIPVGMSDPLQRRMVEMQQSPQMQIADSIDSLKYIQDQAQRQALAAPLIQAQMKARQGV